MIELNEATLARVLSFVSAPEGRLCCKAWNTYLVASLQLKLPIDFCRMVFASAHGLDYTYEASNADGTDFEESRTYSFCFFANRHYRLSWSRISAFWNLSGDESGTWTVKGESIFLTALDVRVDVRSAQCQRIAPLHLPLRDVIRGRVVGGGAFTTWEEVLHQVDQQFSTVAATDIASQLDNPDVIYQEPDGADAIPTRSHATNQVQDRHFVEVDGDLYEVSTDIVQNWPESEWERVMRTRVRFGIAAVRV
eukprot:TRINITY_DN48943_c0_g1_i1.p1 TRINITY_DN48943_c0_g1~~TRINITY_DN48943_c0_g1_i1.p1  ORF type:complete len:251 (+),score=18.28 TRINITY_DN48943_c0_g1_i1:48-800(+)